jgi:aminoglycoside phosphotransferase (APT) family kinase protein
MKYLFQKQLPRKSNGFMNNEFELEISVALVSQLIAEQFPQWADLPIRPVAVSGWDNRTFHLGDNMSVRLPSGQEYAAQVAKEQTWLPILAQQISIPISQPIAMGQPSQDYPFCWSVYRWIDGRSANMLNSDELDLNMIAVQLAEFLDEIHQIDSTGGPVTDRGGSPIFYDDEARATIMQLHNLIDTDMATIVWDAAIESAWHKPAVWAHGDLSSGNILVKNRQLCAVIDFGSITIGDPACDLVIAWTFLHGESREIFKKLVNLDDDTWARARGWALWKAMITVVVMQDKSSAQAVVQFAIINDILDEHRNVSC